MDEIKNMVAWKHEYNRMVTKKLVVGPRLHIKMPVEKTKTEEPSKEDQIKLQQAKEDIDMDYQAPPKQQQAKSRQTKIPQYFKPSTEMPTEDIDVDYQVPTADIMMELYANYLTYTLVHNSMHKI